ncbi:MAG: hypothetical protein WCK33_02355 [Phycisphaerae bacterium]
MDRGNFRSLLKTLSPARLTRTPDAIGTERPSPSSLLRSVGRALGLGTSRSGLGLADSLEQRSMLEGSFGTAIVVALNGSGQGNSAGAINPAVPATNNDFYRFTAPTSDFVTVLADTANEAPASTLDTRVTVYAADQTTIVSQGANNGTLSRGLATDGWAGFVAQAGQTYYVVVSSEGTAQGAYTLRVDARTTGFDVGGETPQDTGIGREAGSPVPAPPLPPITPILGTISRRQEDIVYKYVAPASTLYNSLVTVNAQSTQTANLLRRLDTRLDVYNAQGQAVSTAKDSDSGRINDAFTTFKANPGDVFYVRVRSDEIANANVNLATGPFFLVFDGIATELALNPVTRIFSGAGAFTGFGGPTTPPVPAVPDPVFQTDSYRFRSLGAGTTIITVQPTGLAPVSDPAVRLYDASGTLIAYNDNFVGASSQLEVQLEANKTYFIVVDGFEINSQVQYTIDIESNHTFDPNPETANDDHVNNPIFGGGAVTGAVRREFEKATMLTWNQARLTLDANQNPLRDRGYVADAFGTGRIHRSGDTDLFQFIPQVDMLNEHPGDNNDAGTSLFVGGRFALADPNTAYPVTSRNLVSWDARDYWYVGPQYDDAAAGVTYGFNNNAATAATAGPEIYALFDWDPDPTFNPANGLSDRILMIGGDFDLILPGPFGPLFFRNLIGWAQDPQTGEWGFVDPIGSANAPVRAFAAFDPVAFDPDGGGAAPQLPDPSDQVLCVGGDFTNIGGTFDGTAYAPGTAANLLASFDAAAGAWTNRGAGLLGANASVRALTTFDPADPGDLRAASAGPPPLTLVADPYDPPISLIIGGSFTGGITTWDGRANLTPLEYRSPTRPAQPATVNGVVNALTVMMDNDPDGDAGPDEAQEVLVIAGRFTNAGTQTNVGNIVKFGRPNTNPATSDPQLEPYNPFLKWEKMVAGGVGTAGGTNLGEIHALRMWDPPDINNGAIAPILVIGGNFDTAEGGAVGNIYAYGNPDPTSDAPGFAFNPFGLGALNTGGRQGIIRTLSTIVGGDVEEPSIASNLRTGNPQDPLYLGGDFTQVQLNPAGQPITARGVAQFSAFRGLAQDFFNFSALAGGVSTDVDATNPATVPGSVFALATFDDGDPFTWDHHDRRATRLSITLQPDSGAFLDTWVRVYDSNLNLVYDFSRPGSNTISPPFPDPAGMVDQSLAAPQADRTLEGIKLWGGQTYYIEVSAGPGGANGTPAFGLGRYTLQVTADALALDVPIAPATAGDGVPDEMNATWVPEPGEGSFATAIKIPTTLATGDATSIVNANTPPLHGNSMRMQKVTPSLGAAYNMGFDDGIISTLTDTDLYYFRAEFTGTAEIRLATLGIPDTYGEQIGNTFRGDATTYSSPLDGALRIFDNDFQQLAYNNDSPGIVGEFLAFGTGGTTATYRRTDPRVVINVESGKQYFIQVESGQRYKDGSPAAAAARVASLPRETNLTTATGSYVVIVNAMAQQDQDIENGVSVTDDHVDGAAAQATVIPISNAGTGSITGVINNTPVKPADTDLMRFISPGFGNMTVRLTTTDAAFNSVLRLFTINPGTGTIDFVADGLPSSGGLVQTVTTAAQAGQEFVVLVAGLNGSEGSYTINVSGIPFVDDHANFGKWADATDIKLFDFLGSGSVTGSIEVTGDVDVFRFQAITYQRISASVTALDASLTAAISIYEVSEDPVGNPVFLRIGDNANPNSTRAASVLFPVSTERTIDVAPIGAGPEDRTYPYYYVVVRGQSPNVGNGRYRVDLSFTATDDHPDGSTTLPFVAPPATVYDNAEFSFATNVAVDSDTGRGSSLGTIETLTDTDLFKFTAPANGEATILISRPAGSIFRPMLTIVNANAAIILDQGGLPAQAFGEDNAFFFQATVTINVTRGQTYYLIVQGFEDPGVPNVETSTLGNFTVSVNSSPIDDYPNIGEFTLSNTQGVVAVSPVSGLGQLGGSAAGDPSNPRISPSSDTDLFNFTARNGGNYSITVNPFNSGVGRLAPKITLFSAAGVQLQQVLATAALQSVTINIAGVAANTKFYVLVGANVPIPTATPTGEYNLRIVGPPADVGTDPGEIDFTNPTILPLNPRNGESCYNDRIDVAGDRDLFKFRTLAAGKVYLQLLTPKGSLLGGSISIQNAANETIASRVAFDSDGYAGVAASVSFNAAATTDYWVIVDGLGDSVGTYQLCLKAAPSRYQLYFPEGFASDQTREFISIVNPNGVAANYTVYLRYELSDVQTQISNSTVAAGARGGVTIVDGTNYLSAGVRKNEPYSVVIESDQPLGATLAHYDFGSSIGDSFTERLSSQWNFARVERDNGNVLDFVVFYNPSNFPIDVTLTAYQNDLPAASLTKTFSGLRRGGFSLNDIPNFPGGIFSVVLTAKATNPANQAAFEGVAASLSHYEIGADAAWGLLGDPDNGSTAGAITNFSKGTFSRSEAIFFNPNDVPVTVSLTGSYLRSTLPAFSRTFDVKAKGQVVLTDADFGLINEQPVGLRYTSSLPITVSGANYQQGDADSSTGATTAGTRFLFGDAFMDPILAGSKFFEYLYLYNPTASGSSVAIKLNFTDGTSSTFNVAVDARGFAEVRLHQRPELTGRSGPTWFAIDASSITPFVMTMTHYDLLLGGGWATTGVPLGFVNPVSRIP